MEENQHDGDAATSPPPHRTKKPRLTQPDISAEFAHHNRDVARINNGSFGSCPRSVLDSQRIWQLKFLQQPDDFYFNTLRKGILHSRTVIKQLINADDVDEISLIDNATTAAAIVLQQIGRGFDQGKFTANDTVLMLHCAFQAVKKSIQAYVTRAGGSVIEVQLPFPVNSNEEIISEFKRALAKGKANGKKVRLAIIDHITSMPCVVIPVRELVKLCREEGVDRVFVDGAHAIGSVNIDVKEIGADFYVSNLHKWFFCPPSVAFLHCRKAVSSEFDVHHPVVSHEFGNGLPIESSWIGTRDYSSQLIVPMALEFVNRFHGGIEGIMKRNHDEVVKMGKMLVESWGTSLGSPPEMCAGMIMVGLPSRLRVSSEDDALRLRSHLRECHGVEVPIHFQELRGGEGAKDKNGVITAYARISHQVYNKFEDYCKLRDAINHLVENRQICRTICLE